MGESVGIELFSAASSQASCSRRSTSASRQQGLINEYYEASFQQIIDEGATLYGVDIGSMYATEIDTIDDLMAANARLAAAPGVRRPRRCGPPSGLESTPSVSSSQLSEDGGCATIPGR